VSKVIVTLLICLALAMPAAAGEAPYVLCPVNCEYERPLYLDQAHPLEGDDIRELQQQLQAAGLYSGNITGTYSPATAAAVHALQELYNLKPDGVVDGATRYLLGLTPQPVAAQETVPPPSGEVELLIDVRNRTLTVLNDGYPYYQFKVAVGKTETPTPVGNWSIRRKAMNWGTGFGTRWMGLNVPWGIYGIHGTNKPYSIGTRASHGCIRMFNKSAEQLYSWVEVNTPVHIVGNIMGPERRPTLVLGDRESGVLEIQRLMKKHGYYDGPIDGIFGPGLQQAVIQFRKDFSLRYDNRVDAEMYELLGL